MSIVRVYGAADSSDFSELRKELQKAASSIPSLSLKEEDILVYFTPESEEEISTSVTIFVDLYRRKERTPKKLKQLSQACVNALRDFTEREIGCYVNLLDPELASVLPAVALQSE